MCRALNKVFATSNDAWIAAWFYSRRICFEGLPISELDIEQEQAYEGNQDAKDFQCCFHNVYEYAKPKMLASVKSGKSRQFYVHYANQKAPIPTLILVIQNV